MTKINSIKKFAIIGSGAMGTAMGKVISDGSNNNEVIIYGIVPNELVELQKGQNSTYFGPEVTLPHFKVTDDLLSAVRNADYIILAVPSKVVPTVLVHLAPIINEQQVLISTAKGFYAGEDGISVHEGIELFLKENKINLRGVVSLVGPSHAEEIVLSMPTAVVATGHDFTLCTEVCEAFTNKYFKIYVQRDVIGALHGSAYKNVIAIASGIANGLGYGINTTALILTRGLKEMQVFVSAMGGQAKTLCGLAGIGDLIVTAMSDLSRNYTLGKDLVLHGKNAIETNKTVEGLFALKFIVNIGKAKKLELPIAYFLYDVIWSDKSLQSFQTEIWTNHSIEE